MRLVFGKIIMNYSIDYLHAEFIFKACTKCNSLHNKNNIVYGVGTPIKNTRMLFTYILNEVQHFFASFEKIKWHSKIMP